MDPDNIFVPNKKAKHNVPCVFSSSNLTQKRKDEGKQKKQTKRAHVEISSSDESDEDLTQFDDVPNRIEENKLQCKPPPHCLPRRSDIQVFRM